MLLLLMLSHRRYCCSVVAVLVWSSPLRCSPALWWWADPHSSSSLTFSVSHLHRPSMERRLLFSNSHFLCLSFSTAWNEMIVRFRVFTLFWYFYYCQHLILAQGPKISFNGQHQLYRIDLRHPRKLRWLDNLVFLGHPHSFIIWHFKPPILP